jgi:hypothetical protein
LAGTRGAWRRAALALWCGAVSALASPASDPGPWLVFDIAKSVYATANQGGNFVVEVVHAGGRDTVYRAVWGAEAGVWLPQAVNLSPYAGQTVKLRLQTIAAYHFSSMCFLFWGRPRLVVGALEGAVPPREVEDLTEAFRLGTKGRHYLVDPEHSAPLKTDQYDLTSGYYDYAQAGPWAEPALFGHPFCFGFQGWAGYEFEVTLPVRPPVVSGPPASLTPPPAVVDGGPVIPIFTWDQQVYRGAEGGYAAFDPLALALSVRMPRTEPGFGYAFAGFESSGCDTLWLRLEFDSYEPWTAYGEMTENRFAGVVLDYHTPRGYARRVWLHHVPTRPERPAERCERRAPTWHMDLSRPRRVLEVNWEQVHAELPPGPIVGLDVSRWAPGDWDGRFWLGIGVQDVGSGRELTARVLDRRADR